LRRRNATGVTAVNDASRNASANRATHTALQAPATEPAGSAVRPAPPHRSFRNRLRLILIGLDAVALMSSWAVALLLFPHVSHRANVESAAMMGVLTVLGVWIMDAHDLYLARTSAIRSVELSRLFRSVVILGTVGLIGSHLLHLRHNATEIVAGSAFSLVALIISRSTYRAWLGHARRNGRYTRAVVLVGTNDEASKLLNILTTHPDLGFDVVGVLGDREEARTFGMAGLWCGTADQAAEMVTELRATGAMIAMGAIPSDVLNIIVRDLQRQRSHIHLSSGISGIDYRRLRSVPIAYEPLFYLESPALSQLQLGAKRTIDLVGGMLGLLLVSPLFLALAVAVKLQDRGPVFFRQTRVGRNGKPFTVFKFRTMVVDAEAKLAALAQNNERNGPLFKMENDPRVTRVGRFLRESSLDELPQLINVVRGEMSLVGPRPALPSEVETFDDELAGRNRVRPGITGLWQVEARDNPSFAAYRRLDLFYVDNWSVSLDLVLMVATFEQVIAKLITSIFGGRGSSGEKEADTLAEISARS
jgi:exopolysaccharide biosynthesis polyprenyl glycosylphosphotransferase